eukprot:543352-Rhodomonas_salina.1
MSGCDKQAGARGVAAGAQGWRVGDRGDRGVGGEFPAQGRVVPAGLQVRLQHQALDHLPPGRACRRKRPRRPCIWQRCRYKRLHVHEEWRKHPAALALIGADEATEIE